MSYKKDLIIDLEDIIENLKIKLTAIKNKKSKKYIYLQNEYFYHLEFYKNIKHNL